MLVDYLADGTRQVTGLRVQKGIAKNVQDQVIDEQPVALVYNGLAQVVMLVTPVHLEEFALGFSMSEGILAGRHELYDLEIHCTQAGTEIVMTVANRAFEQLKRQKRSLAGRTGCGLCWRRKPATTRYGCAKINPSLSC